MSRFEALGHFVYEKGDRIGVTLDEAAIELAQKLNAYQMRVERLKEQDRSQTESHRINTTMWKDENARLKAEVERLTKAGDAMLAEWKNTQAGHYSLDEAELAWNAAKEGKGQP